MEHRPESTSSALVNAKLIRLEALCESVLQEARKYRVDQTRFSEQVNEIRTTDFRILACTLGFIVLGLVFLIFKAFGGF